MWGTPVEGWLGGNMLRFIPTHVGNTTHNPKPGRENTVHPHACGEHKRAKLSLILGDGSSPRMWGTHQITKSKIYQTRFIPTHVGNTKEPVWMCGFQAVHPHACGEHVQRPLLFFREAGSSPRMWGTLLAIN